MLQGRLPRRCRSRLHGRAEWTGHAQCRPQPSNVGRIDEVPDDLDDALCGSIVYDQNLDLHHHTTDRYHDAKATHRRLYLDGAYRRHILHDLRRNPIVMPTCGSQLGHEHRTRRPWRVLASKLNAGAVIYFDC